MEREQAHRIRQDLNQKMVFLSGPRQVGKSHLARTLSVGFEKPVYLNWDNAEDRKIMLAQAWSVQTDFLVLDEIHKMEGWKNFLKGIWDTRPPQMRLLVTGSARLETFRQSGDSLAGRFWHHRLLPLTPAETTWAGLHQSLEHHLIRGGFPEPWLTNLPQDAQRWRRQYQDGLIREDVLSFENIHQLKSMSLLVELLRQRVASPISYQSLSEDLGISPNTVKHYLEILEALYIIFKVHPHHHNIARALTQQPKVYFFDTGLVPDDGAALENLTALALLKELYRREDQDGLPRTLRYLRTKEGQECDFVVVEEEIPRLMVEVKTSERTLSANLVYFHEKYGLPGVQVVADLRREEHRLGLKVVQALPWLEALPDLDWTTPLAQTPKN